MNVQSEWILQWYWEFQVKINEVYETIWASSDRKYMNLQILAFLTKMKPGVNEFFAPISSIWWYQVSNHIDLSIPVGVPNIIYSHRMFYIFINFIWSHLRLKKELKFYRFIGNRKKLSVQGLNFCPPACTTLDCPPPNWHFPQLTLFAIFCVIENKINSLEAYKKL